jgi:hypothetical protein
VGEEVGIKDTDVFLDCLGDGGRYGVGLQLGRLLGDRLTLFGNELS